MAESSKLTANRGMSKRRLRIRRSFYLGAFRKILRKAIMRFVLSLCPCLSARNNWKPTVRTFKKFDI